MQAQKLKFKHPFLEILHYRIVKLLGAGLSKFWMLNEDNDIGCMADLLGINPEAFEQLLDYCGLRKANIFQNILILDPRSSCILLYQISKFNFIWWLDILNKSMGIPRRDHPRVGLGITLSLKYSLTILLMCSHIRQKYAVLYNMGRVIIETIFRINV